jgi:hypothetical protein
MSKYQEKPERPDTPTCGNPGTGYPDTPSEGSGTIAEPPADEGLPDNVGVGDIGLA